MRAEKTSTIETVIFQLIDGILRYGSYLVMGLFILHGGLTVSDTPVLIVLSGYLFSSVNAVVQLFLKHYEYQVARERLQTRPEILRRAPAEETVLLSAEHIGKRYGDKAVLSDISLSVKEGERVLIHGKNGCGKSTLLNILLGLTRADEGETAVCGDGVSFALQEEADLPLSEMDIIQDLQTTQALDMSAFRSHLEGFAVTETMLRQPISALSMGERKKFYLAATLARKARLLMLDEPTNHLDSAARTYLYQQLRGFRYGSALVERYLYLPLHEAGKVDAATLVKRISEDTTEYYFYLMQKWTRPVTLAGYLWVLLGMIRAEQMPPVFVLAMAGLAAIPLIRAAVLGKQKAQLKNYTREYEESRDGMQYGLLHGRDFLRGFHLRENYIYRMHQQYEEYRGKTGEVQDRHGAADQVFGYLCTYGVPLGVITLGALLVAGGTMSIGALLAGYLIMPTLTRFYEYVEELLLGLHNEKHLRGRLSFLYAGSEKEESNGKTPLDQIMLKGVSFSYPAAKENVFTDKSLLIPAREHVRIKGANGSGKSTLLALVAGVTRPQSGHITDAAGNPLSYSDLRHEVSLQEQDGQLFSATITENLFVPADKLPEAARLLQTMGMKKPPKTMLLENGSNLSPGERKKIVLVRALMKPSQLLAMDEPLNHLDKQGMQGLLAACADDRRGMLVVSHRDLEQDTGRWTEITLDS